MNKICEQFPVFENVFEAIDFLRSLGLNAVWRFQIEVQNFEMGISHSPLSFWRGDAQAAGAA